ncbi:MAG TPA: inositol monophosphatase family protein [Actinomycetota bacterium]|nr:inositol monophosphatase family protein [Actinomycetota bacterium]
MTVSEPGEEAELAEVAARLGGEVVAAALGTGAAVDVKGAGDYVTEIDRRSEHAIASFLEGATGVPVVGEERGGHPGERYWLVDPLDGTTNFVHGFWAVGVSVALVEGGRPTAGAVHAPFLGQTWTAARGRGSWSVRGEGGGGRRERLAVSGRPVERAIVGTGFPFRRKELLGRYLEVFRGALERFEDLRRPGAAALDLAWVAGGVFEGFFELALSPWDVAAGALLIEEAGGVVTDWAGGDGWMAGDVLAGTPAVHEALLRLATGAGGGGPGRSASAG